MLKIVTVAVVVIMLQMPALAASEESSWYKPNVVQTHNNRPNFFFLLGDWESSDPLFKESWNTTAKGDLFGYRSYQHLEYDLIAFTPSIGGNAAVTMRRMGSNLCDLPQQLLAGEWSAPVNHRGELKFRASGQEPLEILNKYDNPDQNTLILQIDTTSKGVTTSQTLTLKRCGPKK